MRKKYKLAYLVVFLIIIVMSSYIHKHQEGYGSNSSLNDKNESDSLNNTQQKIKVLTDVDGAVLYPAHECEIDDKEGTVSFNISARNTSRNTQLHVRIVSSSSHKKIRLRFYLNPDEAKNPQRNLLKQGMFVTFDGINWDRRLLNHESNNWYSLELNGQSDFQIACDVPYGRDNLNRLAKLLANDNSVNIREIGEGERIFPLFEYGEDDGKKPIHYIIAGECNYETAAQWIADEMIRYLHSHPEIVLSITKHHILRIIPKVSPYTFTNGNGRNFLSEDHGSDVYAAAKWADILPPSEMMHLKNEVLGIKTSMSGATHIDQKRLHYVFVMHSWKTQADYSGVECVSESHAGKKLKDTPDSIRYKWAQNCMELMTLNFPRPVKSKVAKSWFPGIARDYFLDEFNMLTFRIEFTTVDQGIPEYIKTGRTIIDNLNNLGEFFDWTYVYP